MLYRLVKITDLNGVDKTQEDAVNRIGRILDIDADKIEIDKRLYMECVEPSVLKSIITSWVKHVTRTDDGLIITTENSMYFMKEETRKAWKTIYPGTIAEGAVCPYCGKRGYYYDDKCKNCGKHVMPNNSIKGHKL